MIYSAYFSSVSFSFCGFIFLEFVIFSTSLYILRSQTHDGFLLIFNTAEVLAAFEDTGHMAVAHNKDAVADPRSVPAFRMRPS